MNGEPGRLTLITPPAFDSPAFAPRLAAALAAGGVNCVRLAMDAGEDALRAAVAALQPVCAAAEVALIIADHPRLARALGLDGVHLSDGAPAAVRRARADLGPDAVVGADGAASRHRAMGVAEAGADYVSLRPVQAGSLGDGAQADPDLFAWWSEMIETPCVAEGGVTPDLAAALAPHADYVAARFSVWDAPDPAAAVRAYADALR